MLTSDLCCDDGGGNGTRVLPAHSQLLDWRSSIHTYPLSAHPLTYTSIDLLHFHYLIICRIDFTPHQCMIMGKLLLSSVIISAIVTFFLLLQNCYFAGFRSRFYISWKIIRVKSSSSTAYSSNPWYLSLSFSSTCWHGATSWSTDSSCFTLSQDSLCWPQPPSREWTRTSWWV